MKYDDVKQRLFAIINSYIDDGNIREKLLQQAQIEQSIRGVLYSLDEHKNRNFSKEDLNFCADLFFYFG
ncbi:hypothetical protein [Streptococcus ruminantium]|uniref:hypothetical protein n=1 Tax=Streptococcus ruminantium TaxID=1917441 RepID=UPI0012DDF032|nr:hypothetical protein [Streptococcus ruminantium]MDQ8767694.1 hypothetical protein [Streptococcus ruminantium]MDQ8780769.1 hypothetical protein [Streptococcus ruminantium]